MPAAARRRGSAANRAQGSAGTCRFRVAGMRVRLMMRGLGRRLVRDEGYTLVELITVILVVGTVMAPLVTSFATGVSQEVSQTRREMAYGNARLALQRM